VVCGPAFDTIRPGGPPEKMLYRVSKYVVLTYLLTYLLLYRRTDKILCRFFGAPATLPCCAGSSLIT